MFICFAANILIYWVIGYCPRPCWECFLIKRMCIVLPFLKSKKRSEF